MIGVAIRAIAYASAFIGFVLVYLPGRALEAAGVVRPVRWGLAQWLGAIVTVSGAALVVWCILSFVVIGRGTPAPFDPPRRLVVLGPYRHVRNPMYVGAALALIGAALVYQSVVLLAYAIAFLIVLHLFVLVYEEPTLRQTFGRDYDDYCQRVRRWRPTSRGAGSQP